MKTSSLLFIVAGGIVLYFCAVCTGQTITVNAAGGADFTSIQAAIADAGTVSGDQIQVAPGTYNEAINFLGKAVRLYSSSGAEATIIDGNDAYRVVQCISGEDPNTILEGFTITRGYAYSGGGILNDSSSPTVTNCTFTDNSANYYGGGMWNFNSSPTVTNCTFTSNSATNSGGAMYNENYSSPTVTDCTFTGNSADYAGGGMYSFNSNPAMTNCTFTDNSANYYGGGMYNGYSSSPTVTDCTFINNSATYYGGGMYNLNSSPTVTNCIFSNNSATINSGGGMSNENYSSPTVTNCVFTGNSAVDTGGGMFNSCSNSVVTNCIFNSNFTQSYGGGMGNNYNSTPAVANCTFVSNTASVSGGAIFNDESSPNVSNSILWCNTPDEISSDSYSSPSVSYCDVGGSYTGAGNINSDPNFINAASGNLRLSRNSPCIDRGKNSAVPGSVTTDLNGCPRFMDVVYVADMGAGTVPIVDMGAYEFLPADIDGSGIVNDADFEILSSYWLRADSDYHLWEDAFEADSSSQYTFEDSYGSGGTYTIAGGTLNITPAYDNTAAVMTSNPVMFAVGDTLSLDVPGLTGSSQAAIMMCSTTAGHPNGTTTFGFRFRRDAEGTGSYYFRMNLFPGIAQVGITDPSPTKPATLKIVRVSDTDFVYSVVIEGFQTTLGSFSLSQLSGITNLHIGAQAYRYTTSQTFIFDKLRVFQTGRSYGANLNGDMIVNMEDLMEMVEYWLTGNSM